MSEKIIVTIDREYGSGGHDIGEKLAKRLGIKFYDDELINIAAKEMGFHEEYVRNNEEKIPTFSVGTLFGGFDPMQTFPQDNIQAAEFDLIRKLASEESCVIVGRAADYILQKTKHVSVFIFAPVEDRIARVKKNNAVYGKTFVDELKTDADYEKQVKFADKQRRRYYEFYTDNKWGARDSYDLLINAHRSGIDGAVDIIETYIKASRDQNILSDLK